MRTDCTSHKTAFEIARATNGTKIVHFTLIQTHGGNYPTNWFNSFTGSILSPNAFEPVELLNQ